MSKSIEVVTSEKGDYQVVSFSEGKRLDSANATIISEELQDLTAKLAIVDVSNTAFMSSAMLRELVYNVKTRRRREDKQDMVIVGRLPNRSIEVLIISGMDSVFEIFATVEDAIAAKVQKSAENPTETNE